ncbi:MAG: FAD-binding protein [Firmicutes bacterium]|nr:FAD-binding protein [Bacillota bacterium]
MYDLIIIGAGPAGLTAGIYARRANLKTLILEKETIGGQISSSPVVENYPGYEEISGAELSNHFFNQAINLGADFEIEEVVKIIDGKIKKVITDIGEYEAKAIIIATGARHRLLGLENESDLLGKGIHLCATCDGAFYKNKNVAVVGGANTAVQNAIYLSNICKRVFLICRKDKLKCEKRLLQKVEDMANVDILYNSNIKKINGAELESIIVDENGKQKKIEVEGLFISIGLDPNNELASDLLELGSNGYFLSDDCKTVKSGIFVAGDCRTKDVRQLTTAVNDGTIAAILAMSYINEM